MTQHDKIIYNAGQYSFCIESILFPQLTKEQQKVWAKELERAYIAGANGMKEFAIPAKVVCERYDSTGVYGNIETDYINLDKRCLQYGDRVKVIVLEEWKQ